MNKKKHYHKQIVYLDSSTAPFHWIPYKIETVKTNLGDWTMTVAADGWAYTPAPSIDEKAEICVYEQEKAQAQEPTAAATQTTA